MVATIPATARRDHPGRQPPLRHHIAAWATACLAFAGARPKAAVALAVVLTLVLAPGFTRLRIDGSYSSYAPTGTPEARAYARFVEAFGSDQVTVVYLRSETALSAAQLAAAERLSRGLERLDGVASVTSLFTATDIRPGDDAVIVTPFLVDPATVTIDDLLARAAANPFVGDLLLSADGHSTALVLSMARDWSRERDTDRTVHGIDRLLAAERHAFADAFHLGPPRITYDARRAVVADLQVLGPLSVVVLAACYAFFLRAWIAVLLPIVTAGVSLLWTFGLCGLTGLPLNVLGGMLPLLLVAIGATEDAFMLSAYLRAIRADPAGGRAGALSAMAEECGVASFLIAATTVVGFAANAITPIPLVEEFSLMISAAMALNYVATVLLLPALLRWLGPAPRPDADADHHDRASDLVGRVVSPLWRRHAPAVLILSGVVGLAAVAAALLLRPLNDPVAVFRKDHPLPRAVETVSREFAGPLVLYVVLEAAETGFFRTADGLALLDRVRDAVATTSDFDKTLSFIDHLRLVDGAFRAGADRSGWSDLATLLPQYMLLLRPNDVARFVTPDLSSANLVVLHGITDSRALERRLEHLDQVIRAIMPAGTTWTFSGRNVVVQRAAQEMVVGNLTSFAIVVLVSAVLIALALGGARLALLSLWPNLLPAGAVAVLMLVADIPLTPGTALVEAAAFGVVIDDTIHLLAAFRRHLDLGSDTAVAIDEALRDCVRPTTAVALAMAAALGVCAVSEFSAVADFGLLSAFALLVALPTEFIVTPALLAFFGRARLGTGKAA